MKHFLGISQLWAVMLVASLLISCGINGNGAEVTVQSITTPEQLKRGPVPIGFVLSSSETTEGHIDIQYRSGDDSKWRTCSPYGRDYLASELAASTDGTSHVFMWDVDADLLPDEVEDVLELDVAVRISSSVNRIESGLFPVILGNMPPVVSFIKAPDQSMMGTSELTVSILDQESDAVTLSILRSRGTDEPDTITSFVVNGEYVEQYTFTGNGDVEIAIPWIDVFEGGEHRQVNIALQSSDTYGPGKKLLHRNMTINIPVDVSIQCSVFPVTQRGRVTVPCTVYGPPYEYYSLQTLYRDPFHPELDWQFATVAGDLGYFMASPDGVDVGIAWDSAIDLYDMIFHEVQLEVRLQPLGLRTLMSVSLNNARQVVAMAISEVFVAEGQSFIELYGHPGFNLEEYAITEVYKNGTYDLSQNAGFVQLPEDSIIPDDGFLVIGESEDIPNVDVVDPKVASFFKFGFPTNLVLFKPLDQREYYDRDKVKVVDALAIGTFTEVHVFDGRCDFTQRRAEEQGNEDIPCPLTAAAAQPEEGQSACRIFSNLDLGENNLDWDVCDTPTPGEGNVADPLQ